MTRLLATADWQLGVNTLPLDDQEQQAHRIVDLAIERDVDVFLHAGDIFEGPTVTPEHLRAFRRPLARLRAAGIPVVAICGNGRHDAAMREVNGLDVFDDILGITVSVKPEVLDVAGVSVATLPWTHPGELIARYGDAAGRDEVFTVAGELLGQVAADLRARCAPGQPAVLMLHWTVGGAALPSGLPVDAMREPIIAQTDLDAAGFDLVVAGHIHRPQYLGGNGFYCGSPWTLNHGEEGFEHGVRIVDLAAGSSEFVEIESRSFVTVDWEIGRGPQTWSDDAPYGSIVRVRYTATREQARLVDVNEIRAALVAAGAARVSFQAEIVREQRARVEGLDAQLDTLGALDLYLGSQEWDADRRLRVRQAAAEILETVA